MTSRRPRMCGDGSPPTVHTHTHDMDPRALLVTRTLRALLKSGQNPRGPQYNILRSL